MSVLEISNEAVLLNSKYSAAWYNRGHIILASRKVNNDWVIDSSPPSYQRTALEFDQALEYFEKAIAVNSNWEQVDPSDVWYYRGFILLIHKNNKNEAMKSYQKALEINPGNKEAQKALEQVNQLINQELNLKDYVPR